MEDSENTKPDNVSTARFLNQIMVRKNLKKGFIHSIHDDFLFHSLIILSNSQMVDTFLELI